MVLGNRLGVRQVGYTPETWARAAFVVMVYNDSVEISESRAHIELPVKCDLKVFLNKLLDTDEDITYKNSEWITVCNKWKNDYPVVCCESEHCHQKTEVLMVLKYTIISFT